MNPRIYAPVLVSALLSVNALANVLEEVIVTSSLIDQTLSDIENPLHVVSGDDISATASQSLGESLDGLLGVSSADYGSGVGQPIIRGMSGNRVKILNNGMIVRDVAGIGVDHVNDVDLNNIQQIEIVRGPSSLLYANGTIGGIINIVDSTIAREDFAESELKLGLEAQSVNDGDSHNLSYQNNLGGLNFSFAYKDSQFDNFDVPTGAILHDEDHEDEHVKMSTMKMSTKKKGSCLILILRTKHFVWAFLKQAIGATSACLSTALRASMAFRFMAMNMEKSTKEKSTKKITKEKSTKEKSMREKSMRESEFSLRLTRKWST